MKKKKEIFITGITGFVGQNLKPYLKEDFDKACSER
jgi:nucleoside-diphosphate-sugar epimerase